MRIVRRRVLFIATAATLGFFATSASGTTTITVNPAGEARLTSPGLIEFTSSEGEVRIMTNLVIRMRLSRSIRKSRGALVGETNSCRGERETITGAGLTVVVRCTTNWRLTYVGFVSPLPRITDVLMDVQNISILVAVRAFGFRAAECLYGGTQGAVTREAAAGGQNFDDVALEFSPRAMRLIFILEQSLRTCPTEGQIFGEWTMEPAQTVALR